MSTKLINFPRFTFVETKDDEDDNNEEGNDEMKRLRSSEGEQRELSCRPKTKIIMKELLMVKGLELIYFKHH